AGADAVDGAPRRERDPARGQRRAAPRAPADRRRGGTFPRARLAGARQPLRPAPRRDARRARRRWLAAPRREDPGAGRRRGGPPRRVGAHGRRRARCRRHYAVRDPPRCARRGARAADARRQPGRGAPPPGRRPRRDGRRARPGRRRSAPRPRPRPRHRRPHRRDAGQHERRLRDDDRLPEDTHPVRRADRDLPGTQAPRRADVRRARARALGGHARAPRARRGTRRHRGRARGEPRQGALLGCVPADRQRGCADARRHRHDRRARHRLLPEARACGAAHLRRRGLAPRPDGAAGRVLILRRFVAGAVLVLLAACARPPELVRRPEHPPPALLIRDVSVLDVEAGTPPPHRDVVVEGARITRVAAAGSLAAPPGAATIAAGGATLLPGLIDMHGHVGGNPAPPWRGGLPDLDANLRAYLYCGVTTILDPADIASQIFPRRERVRRGELLGPTIYAAGPMFTAPGGHPVPVLRQLAPWWLRWYLIPRLAMQVDTPEEARSAVDEVVGTG